MKTTTWLVLGALACFAARPASAASASCDRECLRGTMTTFLYALLKHDASRVPVADKVRVTEDAIEKPLAKLGLLNTVTRLRGYRQDILDERAGMAGADVVVEESGRAGDAGRAPEGGRPQDHGDRDRRDAQAAAKGSSSTSTA